MSNSEALCITDAVCFKGYCKGFTEETVYNTHNTPIYRWRRIGTTVGIGDTVIDNSRIGPYIALQYRTHINFEACVSLFTVKYLHKYVHKGGNCVTMKATAEGNSW